MAYYDDLEERRKKILGKNYVPIFSTDQKKKEENVAQIKKTSSLPADFEAHRQKILAQKPLPMAKEEPKVSTPVKQSFVDTIKQKVGQTVNTAKQVLFGKSIISPLADQKNESTGGLLSGLQKQSEKYIPGGIQAGIERVRSSFQKNPQ